MASRDEALSCPLCLEKYLTVEPRRPCLLPTCFHTFCRECLAMCADQARPFKCPTCREPCGEAVESLKPNFAMLDVIEAELTVTRANRLVCQDCDENADAENHCSQCNLLLCGVCSNNHGRSRQFRTHALVSVRESKDKQKAAPKSQKFCEKHKQTELRMWCRTCEVFVCSDCGLVKDHKNHDCNLEEVAGEYKQILRDEAERIDVATSQVKQAIEAIKEEERALAENRLATKARITEYFRVLAEAVRARGEGLVDEVDGVWETKHKVLKDQREGLQIVVASMSSRAEQAHRTVRERDAVLVMEAYTGLMTGLQDLTQRPFAQSPEITGRLEFVWEAGESAEGMRERIATHGRVLSGEVEGSACVAEGEGLRWASSGKLSTFVVRTFDNKGRACTAGGQHVEVRAAGGGPRLGARTPRLVRASVKDEEDGSYSMSYVAEGAGQLGLEVLVNGSAVPGSPFAVSIVQRVLEMQSAFDENGAIHFIGTQGGRRAFSNPHDSGDVEASMSSVAAQAEGSARRFVQGQNHDGCVNLTKNVAGSWMAVDLKRFRLAPSAYALRSDLHEGKHKLRTWRLEASEDGEAWTTLREHILDTSLGLSRFSTAGWEIEGRSGQAFRYFRVVQTGRNSSGNDYLTCTGIELYGALIDTQEA